MEALWKAEEGVYLLQGNWREKEDVFGPHFVELKR